MSTRWAIPRTTTTSSGRWTPAGTRGHRVPPAGGRSRMTITRALLAAAMPFLAAAGQPPSSPAYRPSVVLVTLDTTRADHLGCYGAVGAATPRLDSLAAHGVRFTQALSPVPLTAPAHASIMTARVPRRHGL